MFRVFQISLSIGVIILYFFLKIITWVVNYARSSVMATMSLALIDSGWQRWQSWKKVLGLKDLCITKLTNLMDSHRRADQTMKKSLVPGLCHLWNNNYITHMWYKKSHPTQVIAKFEILFFDAKISEIRK